jgi:glycosyltransferase involved in cell wall biosynthesis
MTERDRSAVTTSSPGRHVPGSVLMIVPRWTRDGGVSTHVQSSATILARHGLDVRVLAARIESTDEIPGVTLHRCPDLFNADAPMSARIGAAMSFGPQLVHLHQVDLPDVVRAVRASAPAIVSAHNYVACAAGVHYFRPGQECTRAHGPGCVVNMLARGCAHVRNPKSLPTRYKNASDGIAALRSADLAVSYSSAVDRHLAQNGLTARRLVPLPVTITPKSGDGHATRRRVVFAGRIVRPKGVAVLIRAAREVDAEFVICGDGRLLEPMRGLARRIGVQDRVSFTGWLGPEQLAQELADASVVAMPSLWPEPFGLVGIEALAAGRPVIASATGGVSDWLEHGVSGLCVKPGDAGELARALNELLADPRRQHAMGAAGREAVNRRFSPERHLAGVLEAYGEARSRWRQATGGDPIPGPSGQQPQLSR